MSTNFNEISLKLYGLLTRLRSALSAGADSETARQWLDEVEAQLRRIETRKFRVAVVGEFKRGKSSLINALLERDVLPADVLPTTATFNRVVYGETPQAFLSMKDGSQVEVPVDELDQHITKLSESALEKSRQIEEAVVRFPSMFCFHGEELIDTPGLNDDEEMTALTVSRLRETDVAIVAVSASYPFSDTETALVAQLLETSSVCDIVFAVTMMDKIDEEDRDRVLQNLQNRIRDKVRAHLEAGHEAGDPVFEKYDAIIARPKLYGLSSREAARARELQDVQLFAHSGYARFTQELRSILMTSQERGLAWNALHTAGAVIEGARKWTPGRIAELRTLEERLPEAKRQLAAAVYGAVRDDESAALAQAGSQALERLGQVRGKLSDLFDSAWNAAPEDNIGRTAAILDSLSPVYRTANIAVREALGPGLQSALEDAVSTNMGLLRRKADGLLKDLPGLSEALDGEWASLKAAPRLEDLAGDGADALPAIVDFRWTQTPIPTGNPNANAAYLKFVNKAAGESLSQCVESNRGYVNQAVTLLSARRTQQAQAFVRAAFGLAAQQEQAARRERESLEKIDPAMLEQLEEERRALVAKFD